METGGGDGSETGSVTKTMENKSTTDIGACLTADYTDKEERNKNTFIIINCRIWIPHCSKTLK